MRHLTSGRIDELCLKSKVLINSSRNVSLHTSFITSTFEPHKTFGGLRIFFIRVAMDARRKREEESQKNLVQRFSLDQIRQEETTTYSNSIGLPISSKEKK